MMKDASVLVAGAAGGRQASTAFLRLLVSFAPWIVFLILARGTPLRVEIGLVVALALTVLMALMRLHRGVIMWVGLVCFTGTTIAVLGFHNLWTLKHLAVLINGALAVGSWGSMLIGQPFTMAYARQNVDPALWNAPVFIRTNMRITAVWAAAFTFNTALAWLMTIHTLTGSVGHLLSYPPLIASAAFSSWYPALVRRAAAQAAGAESASA